METNETSTAARTVLKLLCKATPIYRFISYMFTCSDPVFGWKVCPPPVARCCAASQSPAEQNRRNVCHRARGESGPREEHGRTEMQGGVGMGVGGVTVRLLHTLTRSVHSVVWRSVASR